MPVYSLADDVDDSPDGHPTTSAELSLVRT